MENVVSVRLALAAAEPIAGWVKERLVKSRREEEMLTLDVVD